MKKAWIKPKLLVLARSSDPEDVLTICKGNSSGSPGTAYANCITGDPCVNCSAYGES